MELNGQFTGPSRATENDLFGTNSSGRSNGYLDVRRNRVGVDVIELHVQRVANTPDSLSIRYGGISRADRI